MSVAISGIGLVTPFGADLEKIWSALENGESPQAGQLSSPLSERTFPYLPVPRELIRALERNPRLRRSSEISHFAALAGLNALADAGIDPATTSERIGVVFAISSGGVRYTTRFFDEIVRQGAGSASPLLFPETVYNAPASHLAALLGLNEVSYTVVGDSAVGIPALALGADLLETGQLDHCVVVGSEEADWILCEAFRTWRFFRPSERVRAFGGSKNRGTVFSEGAGAVVLSRQGPVRVEKIQPATPFFRSKAAVAMGRMLAGLELTPDGVVSGANGTALDDAEAEALESNWPGLPVLAVKNQFGESLGAAVLQQIAVAALCLRHGFLPGKTTPCRRLGITSLGYNALAGGVMIGLVE